MEKQTFRIKWADINCRFYPVPRDRVAYLIRAARSRGQKVYRLTAFHAGYQVGMLMLTKQFNTSQLYAN